MNFSFLAYGWSDFAYLLVKSAILWSYAKNVQAKNYIEIK